MNESLKVNSGKDYKHLSNGAIPVYGTGGYMLSVDDKLSEQDSIGIGRKGTINKPQYLKAPFWTVDTLFFMTPFKQYNINFIYSMAQQINWKKLDESTGVPSLSKVNIEKISQSFPVYEEQVKIGAFFLHLDNTIALHQREMELLKKMKKGFLQKMFTKNEEKAPEVRFAYFVKDWEQRKLKDLATFSKGRGYSKSDLRDEGNPIILYGRLYTKYETVIEEVNTYVKKIENSTISLGNEVIVPASGETSEDISRASVVAKSGIIIGGDLNIINTTEDINSIFLALTISNGTQQKELTRRAQGKSVVHIRNSDLKNVNLQYPIKEEQLKIGMFFNQIDKSIVLHQNKIEKLKVMKKAFLQKMFV